ncbi:MAG: tetratricopeptide repeat protein [Candidatus Omnitrophica bacterium]|nr:tetratricopeptide repeat protein [Candidatus Omnitrophota bacterium]
MFLDNSTFLTEKRTQLALVLLFFVALSFLLYFNSLGNGFVLDDKYLVVKNSFIKDIRYLPQIFKNNSFYFAIYNTIYYYRPLAIVSYALDYSVWGYYPFGYHATNIFLHAFNGFLFFFLLLKLFRKFRLALISALLFVIHPLQTATVNFIGTRDNLLSTALGLLSIIYFLSHIDHNKRAYYVVSLVSFLGAVLAKEHSLLYIPLIALCAVATNRNLLLIARKLSLFVLLAIFYIYARSNILGLPLQVSVIEHRLGLPLETVNFFAIFFTYLRLLILPFNLQANRVIETIHSLGSVQVLLILSCVGVLSMGMIISIRKKKTVWWLGVLWALIALSYVQKAMFLKYSQFEVRLAMSEWWFYMPSMGIFLMVGYVFARLFERSKKAFLVAILMLSSFWIPLTIYNNSFWKSDTVIFNKDAMLDPLKIDARLYLANMYEQTQKYAQAEQQLFAALDAVPGKLKADNLDGAALTGRDPGFSFGQLIKKDLSYGVTAASAIVWNNLGHLYYKQKDEQKALRAYQNAAQLDPRFSLPHANMATIYFEKKEYAQAKTHAKACLRLNHRDIRSLLYLGIIALSEKQDEEAWFAFGKVLEYDPGNIDALCYMGNLYLKRHDYYSAYLFWRRADELFPNSKFINKNLGMISSLKKEARGRK